MTVTRGAAIAAFTLVVAGDELEDSPSLVHTVRASATERLAVSRARVTVFFTPLTIMETVCAGARRYRLWVFIGAGNVCDAGGVTLGDGAIGNSALS